MIDNNTKDFLGTLAGWALDADLGRSLQGAGSDIREAKRLIEALTAEKERLREVLGDLIEAVQRRTADLGGYDGRFGLNKSIVKARAALGETK